MGVECLIAMTKQIPTNDAVEDTANFT